MTRFRVAAATLAAGVVAAAWPAVARACSMCSTGRIPGRGGYYVATLVMLALPLAMAGTSALWLRKRLRGRDGAIEAPPPSEPPSAPHPR